MIIIIGVVLSIPAIAAAWFLIPVYYTASAELRILSNMPYILNAERDNSNHVQYVGTQLAILAGPTVLSRVLDSREIRDIPSLKAATDPLIFLKENVNVSNRRGNEMVTVSFSMLEKDGSLLVLDEILKVYMDYTFGIQAQMGMDRLSSLTEERDARQLELEAQLTKIRAMHGALGIPIVGETPLDTGDSELYKSKLSDAEEVLVRAKNDKADTDRSIEMLKELLSQANKDVPIYEYGVEERVKQDTRVSTIRAQVTELETQLISSLDIEKKVLPRRQANEKRLESLKSLLASTLVTVRKEVLESMLMAKHQAIESLDIRIRESQDQVDNYTQKANEVDMTLANTTDQFVELENLRSKAEETRRILEQVRTSIGAIAMERKASPRMTIASAPTVPMGGPDYLPRYAAMLFALFGSFGLATVWGLWKEFRDPAIRSSADLARLSSVPVIATIPHSDEDQLAESSDMALITEQEPLSVLADSYRHVLARLLMKDEGSIKCLGLISSCRGDGKSTLASNLGIALARTGRRVLIIDISYQRPTQEKAFNLPCEEGLSEILNGKPIGQVRQTQIEGLYVLGPGIDAGDLVGELASKSMIDFLERAKSEFDNVIIDTTPWLTMADSRLVAPLVDSVLVVVGAEVTTRGMARRCLRELAEINANVIGVVLNRARSTSGGYIKANHELYYGYDKEDSSKKTKTERSKERQFAARNPEV